MNTFRTALNDIADKLRTVEKVVEEQFDDPTACAAKHCIGMIREYCDRLEVLERRQEPS